MCQLACFKSFDETVDLKSAALYTASCTNVCNFVIDGKKSDVFVTWAVEGRRLCAI